MQGLIFDFVYFAWNWNCEIRLSLWNFKISVVIFVRSTKRCNGNCFLEFQEDGLTMVEVESDQIKLRWAHHVFHHIHIQNWTPVFFFFYHHHFNYMSLCRSELNIFIPGRDTREADPNLIFVRIRGSLRVPGSTFGSLLELLPARAESAGSQHSTQLSQETCLTRRWSSSIN